MRLIRSLFPLLFSALAGLAAPALAAPALWEVSDGDSSLYLFGSIHLMDKERDWRTEQFDTVLAKADHVYFEVILDAGAYATLTRLSLVYGRYRDGRTLWDDLTAEQAARLRQDAPQYGLALDAIGSMRPWVVTQALTLAMLSGDTAPNLGSGGVDTTLQAEIPAERQRQLETVEIQFRVLAGAPTGQQVEELMATLDELKAAGPRNPLTTLAEHWANGDIAALEQEAFEGMEPGSPGYRRYFSDRNHRWVVEAERLLADNDQSLIVVGAGHLLGTDGLPTLLEQAGYSVRRIDGESGEDTPVAAPSPFAITRR